MPGTAFSTANWSGYDEQSVTNPSFSLTDFTLLIDLSGLSSTLKSTVQSDFGDLRFTKGDNTELPFDLIDPVYNAGAITGFARVKWTATLAAAGTQNVRVWAGYTPGTAVAYDASETFGSDNAYDANWEGYWPLHDLIDRTSNGLDLTAVNSPTSGATGKLGDAYSFDDASSQHLRADIAPFTAAPFTMMAWYNTDSASAAQVIVGVGDKDTTNESFRLQLRGPAGGDPLSGVVNGSGGTAVVDTTTGYSTGVWQHGAYVEYSSSSRAVFLNAANKGTNSETDSASGSDSVHIGQDPEGSTYMSGLIDDVQVHSVARSDDWIAEEYAQSNDNATFWGTWAWTSTDAGGTTLQGSLGLLGVGI